MKNIVFYILIFTIILSFYLEFFKNNKPNKFKERFYVDIDNENEDEDQDNYNNNDQDNYNNNEELGIDIYAELIELDPKYNFDKIEIKNGKIINKKNYDWEKIFLKNLCNEKCGCVKENNNLCSYNSGAFINQCPSFCPKCKKCHFMDQDSLEEKYDSMCDKTTTTLDKEKCEKYKELLRISKSYCFFKKSKFHNIIKDNDKCDIYNSITNINYLENSDILIRISFDYKNKDLKKINDITIDNILLGINKKEFNIFYKTNKEIYLFVKTNLTDIKNNQLLTINGKIFLKGKQNDKTFSKKLIVNILEKPKFEKNKGNNNTIQKKNNKNTIYKPFEEDKYQLNYLEESVILNKYPVNNHSVYNDVKNKKIGEFKREKLIDNPTTWVQRVDIARPWIFTG